MVLINLALKKLQSGYSTITPWLHMGTDGYKALVPPPILEEVPGCPWGILEGVKCGLMSAKGGLMMGSLSSPPKRIIFII